MTITATKPTPSMRWATAGGAQKVDPPSGTRDTGWLAGDRPPAQYLNHMDNAAYLWQQYLESATDELNNSKLERNGSNTITGVLVPDSPGGRDLGASGTRFATVYAQSFNASAGTTWGGTATFNGAVNVTSGPLALTSAANLTIASGSLNMASGNLNLTNGDIEATNGSILAGSSIISNGALQSQTATFLDRVSSKFTPVLWGTITSAGGGSTTVTTNFLYNSSTVRTVSFAANPAGYIQVTIGALNLPANFVILASPATDDPYKIAAGNRSVSGFRFVVYSAAGAVLNPHSSSYAIEFVIFGAA